MLFLSLVACSNSGDTPDGDATDRDGDASDGDGEAVGCEPEALRCSPLDARTVQKCSPEHGWLTFTHCDPGLVCADSECVVPPTVCEAFCDKVAECGVVGENFDNDDSAYDCKQACAFADIGAILEEYFDCPLDVSCDNFRTCMADQRSRCIRFTEKIDACDLENRLPAEMVPNARKLCDNWFALGLNAFVMQCVDQYEDCDRFYVCSKIAESDFVDGDADGDQPDGDTTDGDVDGDFDGDAVDGDADDDWDIEWDAEPSIDNCWHHAEMVPVDGRFCIDKWESTLRDEPNCGGQSYLVDSAEAIAGFPPCVDCEQYNFTEGCGHCTGDEIGPQTTPMYACSRPGVRPAGYVTWFQATLACENSGKSLCLESDWITACQGPDDLIFPYGDEYQENVCWDWWTMSANSDETASTETGSLNSCVTGYRIYDMSGNVEDWTYDPDDLTYQTRKGGRYRDGAYETTALACVNENDYGRCIPGREDCIGGIRCCLYPPD